jgi:parallel beta-helix repeat protein
MARRSLGNHLGIVASLLTVVMSSPVHAISYYVDATIGNDAWSGRVAAPKGNPHIDGPWKTIAKVNSSSFSAGDTINLACGSTWRESLIIRSSGTVVAPIGVARYGICNAVNQPTLNAARIVNGWTRVSASGNIWKAAIRYDVAQILVDSVFVNPAQYPNAGKPFLLTGAGSTSSRIKVDDTTLSASQLSGAGVQIRSINYRMRYRTVAQFNAASRIISWPSPTDGANAPGTGYYLVNKLWMLDSPGEWYFEKNAGGTGGTIYVWLPTSAAPANQPGAVSNVVEATPVNSVALSAAGVANIRIGALRLINADIGADLSGSSGISLNSTSILGSARFGVSVTDSSNALLNAVAIKNSGAQGVQAEYAQNLTISNSLIENSGTVGTLRTSPPPEEYQLYGLNCYGCRAATIKDNTVRNSGYIGIRADPPPTPAPNVSDRIIGNYIENSCTLLDECGAIYTFGRTLEAKPGDPPGYPNRSRIVNNIINHSRGNPNGRIESNSSAQGIYLDDFATGVEVIGNTVIDTDNGIQIHLSKNNIIRQNTLFGNRGKQIWMQENEATDNIEGCPPDGANCIRGNLVQQNLMFPLSSNPAVVEESDYASTTDFASYDQNHYANLYSSLIAKESRRTNTGGVENVYTLSKWQTSRGKDLSSSAFSQFGLAPYRITTLSAKNLVSNSSFPTADISAWTSYSTGISALAWEPNCVVTGCLKLSRTNVAAIMISNSFPVQLGRKYLVRFEARIGSGQPSTATAVMRKNGPTYEDLADTNTFEPSTAWRNFAFIVTANSSYNPARLDIEFPMGSGDVYLDNVVVSEVSTVKNDPSNDALVFFNRNATATHQACPYSGSLASRCAEFVYFWDGASHKTPVVWPVTIPAKGSVIVVWSANPFRDTDHDGVSDSADRCPATVVLDSVDERGCSFLQSH